MNMDKKLRWVIAYARNNVGSQSVGYQLYNLLLHHFNLLLEIPVVALRIRGVK